MLEGAEQPGGQCFSTFLFVITALSFPITLIAFLCGIFKNCLFIYLVLAALGLRCDDGVLIAVNSFVAEHGL